MRRVQPIFHAIVRGRSGRCQYSGVRKQGGEAHVAVLFVEKVSALQSGAVVFEAADGDLLVGLVNWEVDAGGDERSSELSLSWRDSVQLNGTIFHSTGRFADPKNRPRGSRRHCHYGSCN